MSHLQQNVGEILDNDALEVLLRIYGTAVTCVCFMGGDAEPSEVERLAKWIRTEFPHLRTAWYSGRESVPESFDLNCLNYVKTGPYISELGGLKSPTTNQALYLIDSDGSLTKLHL